MPLDFRDERILGEVHLRVKEVGSIVVSGCDIYGRDEDSRIKGLE